MNILHYTLFESDSAYQCDGSFCKADKVLLSQFCGADEDGLCKLDAFEKRQAYAKSSGEED